MTLVKAHHRPADLFDVFDNFFGKSPFDVSPRIFGNGTTPAVNVKETENGFEVEVAAPGLKKEDFKIELDRNVLHISAETRQESEEKDDNGRYSRREFSYGSFRRSFTLPETVEADNIAARYENGVLRLSIPKRTEAVKTSRVIAVA